ncbi:MAG: FecR domain-containing protein [Bosea sp. (in: a-proteobacteria)]|uniref:FecR domain-containing protein n=1 Tax=Bosea sp. (in: a-proteobacteria) TaxID=1871050 RepID=UPI003F7B7187
MTGRFAFWLAVAAAWCCLCSLPAAAQDDVWTVSKSSGEAWVGSAGHPASLTQKTELRPGDSIRTGRNGRVLLVRGQETILVSPNSAISLPEAGRPGMSTVIQQAGTILLDVEKRNVQHFEVETPYLAAVVKGTRFRVSVGAGQTKVDVVRGQVQVTDFRSGDYTLVNPQQFARSSGAGAPGLRLGGRGELGTVLRGPAQPSRVLPLPIPAGGLKPDAGAVRLRNTQSTTSAGTTGSARPIIARTPGGGARIVAPIGELHLNIREVTKGMARNDSAGHAKGKSWSSRLQPGNGGNEARPDNSGSAGPSGTDPSSGSAASATATAGIPAAGAVIISNAATNGGVGNGGYPGGAPGSGSAGGPGSGSGVGGGQGPAHRPGGASGPGQGAGRGGGPGGGPGGLPGVIGQVTDGLGALIENRGRGNAYGLHGGNGIGKAVGLGKKN